jgi:hypothetical protein
MLTRIRLSPCLLNSSLPQLHLKQLNLHNLFIASPNHTQLTFQTKYRIINIPIASKYHQAELPDKLNQLL